MNWQLSPETSYRPDLAQIWYASRALAAGHDPYDAIGPNGLFHWPWPLYYPLSATIAFAPFAWLPLRTAHVLFVGVSGGLLAFGLLNCAEPFALLTFANGAYVHAVRRGQWWPILMAASLLPGLSWLYAAKPSSGLALWLAKPSWGAVAGGTALAVVALAIVPSWPWEWTSTLRTATHFAAPVAGAGGFLLLLAATRWRRPEGRLLLGLALIPHTSSSYEALPLFLVAQSRIEYIALAIGATLADVIHDLGGRDFSNRISYGRWSLLLLCYLPALVMVLRRPNEGHVAAWLERHIARWPAWLRGRATTPAGFGPS